MFFLFVKEIKDYLKLKSTLLFFTILSLLVGYSFYTAVDLYSKASGAALNNPLYATGFEPVQGVFVPTFGALFILLSLLSPFVFINSLSLEKRYNTILLTLQFPVNFKIVFFSKVFSAAVILFLSLLVMIPCLIIWHLLGGHIAIYESIILFLGYFLYGLFVISVSFFSASLFKESSQASVFALAIIIASWFLDFGKEMQIFPLINKLSIFSVTIHLKRFESGILSLNSFFFFVLISIFFLFFAYLFYNFTLKINYKSILTAFILFLLFSLSLRIYKSYDVSESRRNSFVQSKIEFLKKIGNINIKIYLEPTDSRAKDFENDFLKKLRMIKPNVSIYYASEKELKAHYGYFGYSVNGRYKETLSNSEEEIFRILSELSGLKIAKKEEAFTYKGYPLVAKKYGLKIGLFYLILFPLIFSFIFYINNFKKGSYNENSI